MHYADLPLHDGKSPKWLFKRMKELASAITSIIIEEYGPSVFIKRLSDPFWFQAFSCILGFDWHSSGTTTTTVAAIREGYKENSIKILGGKGKFANIEDHLKEQGDIYLLYRKTCSLLHKGILDSYSLYFSSIIFTEDMKEYVIINQGMNEKLLYARRYHWHSSFKFFNNDENIAGIKEKMTINTISKEAIETRKGILDLVNSSDLIKAVKDVKNNGIKQSKLYDFYEEQKRENIEQENERKLIMPMHHKIYFEQLSDRDIKMFEAIKEYKPNTYEEILMFKGLGKKKLRALALISNLIYGTPLDWNDPVKYSFAHGGKDGIPFPVDKKIYDENIELLKLAIEEAKIGNSLKLRAMRALNKFLISQASISDNQHY
jgi:hypothetical protein